MKRNSTAKLSLLFSILLTTTSVEAAVKPRELLVTYKNQSRFSFVSEADRASSGVVRITLPANANVESAQRALEQNPNVESVQPNYIISLGEEIKCPEGSSSPACEHDIPCIAPGKPAGCTDSGTKRLPQLFRRPRPQINPRPQEPAYEMADPRLRLETSLFSIGVPFAWTYSRGTQRVVVAVLDSGVDYNHEDLSLNIWRNPRPDAAKNDVIGWDFIHEDNLPYDDLEHGTHVAGTIGAVGNNGVGISGVAQRVSIMPLKVLNDRGDGDTFIAIKAIDYAIEHGANIIHASWGGFSDPDDKYLIDAIERAKNAGVLFVTAPGNDGLDNDLVPVSPSNFKIENIISVAATDLKDRLADFSNYGAKTVHLAAPGEDVYSTVPRNRYKKISGTSMAAPHVTGAAVLVWAAHPEFTYAEVKQRLLDSVDRLPALTGKTITGGRLNVAKALGPQAPEPMAFLRFQTVQ